MIDFIVDREEKEKLFNDNMKLVPYYLNISGTKNFLYYDYEDLMQTGYVGLWKASCSFDKSKDVKFSTYALYLIRNEILYELRSLRRESQSVTVSIDDSEYDWLFQIVDDSEDLDVMNTYNLCINYLLSSNVITDNDKRIIQLTLDKVPQKVIAEEIHISQGHVSRRLKCMKKYILARFGNPFNN